MAAKPRKEMYQERMLLGFCNECPRKALNNKTRCATCLEKSREYDRERATRTFKAVLSQEGIERCKSLCPSGLNSVQFLELLLENFEKVVDKIKKPLS
jgi:hypothetical protein